MPSPWSYSGSRTWLAAGFSRRPAPRSLRRQTATWRGAPEWHPLSRSSTSFAATASKSAHTRARETPRGCRPACHTARGDGETDSARQTSAPRPIATDPGHSRARCDAWPARERCGESGDRAEWRPRRSRDPRAHSPAAAAVAPIRRAAAESHPPMPALLASRSCSRRSGVRRAARPARHKSDGACSRA